MHASVPDFDSLFTDQRFMFLLKQVPAEIPLRAIQFRSVEFIIPDQFPLLPGRKQTFGVFHFNILLFYIRRVPVFFTAVPAVVR